MNLYHYILIGASVLSICYAKSTTNYATSSHSYNRVDIKPSHKYNLTPIYSTSKPHRHPIQNQKHHIRALPQKPQLVNHENIQYAPLFLRPSEQNSNPQPESEKAEDNTEINTTPYENRSNNENDSTTQQRQEQKRNLFPHDAVTEASDARLRNYVPGYNVDLQAVNNKLMQNGIYASNPNYLVKNKQVNVNYLQTQDVVEEVVPKTKDANTKGIHSILTYPQDIKKYNEDTTSAGQKNKRPFFHVKAPVVELNLARARRIAHTRHKASVNVKSSFRKLPSLPHEFFSNPNSVQPSKTQLHPVQNSKIAYIVRRSI